MKLVRNGEALYLKLVREAEEERTRVGFLEAMEPIRPAGAVLSDGFPGGFPSDRFVEGLYRAAERHP